MTPKISSEQANQITSVCLCDQNYCYEVQSRPQNAVTPIILVATDNTSPHPDQEECGMGGGGGVLGATYISLQQTGRWITGKRVGGGGVDCMHLAQDRG
jgi:hypothetical protein